MTTGIGTSGNSGGTGADIEWMVTDQLGTPRMILDQTGTPASMKRHDYLPFGEELTAGNSERTVGQGYVSDPMRQKWAGKEFDAESGLSYFLARYTSNSQGRFTSVDPYNVAADKRPNKARGSEADSILMARALGATTYLPKTFIFALKNFQNWFLVSYYILAAAVKTDQLLLEKGEI